VKWASTSLGDSAMTTEYFNLAWPTSRTVIGPRLCLDSGALVVDYDFEQDDGSVKWIRITFQDVLAFEYRQIVCCCAEDLDAYNRVVKYLGSEWLKEMLNRRQRFLGGQAGEDCNLYAHWRIYFDDAGCVDVIAQAFEVN